MWIIRRALLSDLDTLVAMRIAFLEEVNNSGDGVAEALRSYFLEMLPSKTYLSWLAIDEETEEPIGTAGFVFLDKPPSGRNPTGREAYIMNVYTVRHWRKKGVAAGLLDSVLQGAQAAGVGWIRLHATDDGEHLYRSRGFTPTATERILKLLPREE
ncbi:GNAT family N-acetyltransferase [Lignipirellula cremea]|uniref:Acetyltransferase (GNAT) family protein n=1 Tax=Lignipirellula cremea TaxID=2528010 RepID=A0A518DY88_9BACT|nr:GNAT family N-acetyltransferase [Lignipirellula cremea]QDU96755.1 Acetyltransferase (GNAT) family protein [Lignipirellula cremea]